MQDTRIHLHVGKAVNLYTYGPFGKNPVPTATRGLRNACGLKARGERGTASRAAFLADHRACPKCRAWLENNTK
jgi:hypothetical protein